MLPIPDFFAENKVDKVWRVPYQERALQAKIWGEKYNIQPAKADQNKICLLLIDVQNTFCIPDFELFVGGKNGRAAVEDNIRLCQFIYRNLAKITDIIVTLDTHKAQQIFHPCFWINSQGEHPQPLTMITLEDIENNIWQVNPNLYPQINNYDYLQIYAQHYVKSLAAKGKYLLTIWPYHAMLGGIGHSLVSSVEEAVFFHNIARCSQTTLEIKGNYPLTENYSVLAPEIINDQLNQNIARKNTQLIEKLLSYDEIIIAGQAKSHCVAWTVEDILTAILALDPSLAQKFTLLNDCTSPVVIPDVIDFTEEGDRIFQRFADFGMKIVDSL